MIVDKVEVRSHSQTRIITLLSCVLKLFFLIPEMIGWFKNPLLGFINNPFLNPLCNFECRCEDVVSCFVLDCLVILLFLCSFSPCWSF
jgi:hypothetical protein